MSRYIVAFAIVALTGALSEPVSAAGGVRMGGGMRMGGGFRGAPMMPRGVGPILRPMHPIAPRGAPGHAIRPHGIGKFHANDIGKFRRTVIPPSAHGYATTTARPFDRLVRRHHVIDQSGWVYPTTIGGDYPYGYIGVPYDPIEAIPVYGPAPAYQESDPPPRGAPAAARVTNPDDEGRDGCRVERVTVPSGSGEREIKVVRC